MSEKNDMLGQIVQSSVEMEGGKNTSHLRYLHSVTLAPTNGSVTIAEAYDVFYSISGGFKQWGTDVPSEDSEKTKVGVYEAVKDADLRTLFGSFGADPRTLCLTQGQVIEFCRTHRQSLRQDGPCMTLFLFKVMGELLVASVHVFGGELCADMHRFWHVFGWRADNRYRLVVKQQTS